MYVTFSYNTHLIKCVQSAQGTCTAGRGSNHFQVDRVDRSAVLCTLHRSKMHHCTSTLQQQLHHNSVVFDRKLSFIPHIKLLKDKCTKALNLLRVLAHTSWRTDQETLLHLYRFLIRSKFDYGCIVYGAARGSYLWMLDPFQNHALRLCLGAYRTSPAFSLCMEANEPPLYFRRKKLSLQYCLKLSCNYNNPAYATVFNSKFHPVFERKPTQLPPLAIHVSGDLQAVGFKKSDVITSSIPTTPLWLLTRRAVNFTLHCSDKSNTPPEIFKHLFYELCHEFKNYYRIHCIY